MMISIHTRTNTHIQLLIISVNIKVKKVLANVCMSENAFV